MSYFPSIAHFPYSIQLKLRKNFNGVLSICRETQLNSFTTLLIQNGIKNIKSITSCCEFEWLQINWRRSRQTCINTSFMLMGYNKHIITSCHTVPSYEIFNETDFRVIMTDLISLIRQDINTNCYEQALHTWTSNTWYLNSQFICRVRVLLLKKQ